MSLRANSAARSRASPCRLQSFAAGIEFSRDAAKLAGGLVADLHECCEIMVSSVRLSWMRCESTSRSASSERASVRMVTTDLVNRSASLSTCPAEHDPRERQKSEWRGGDRDPLSERRRAQ